MLNTIELTPGQLALVERAAARAEAAVILDYTEGQMATMAGHVNCLALGVHRDEDAAIFLAVVSLRDPRLYGILTSRRASDDGPGYAITPGHLYSARPGLDSGHDRRRVVPAAAWRLGRVR